MDILAQLPDDHDGWMLAVAFTLAWATFMRCGEFTVPDGAAFDPSVNLTKACISSVTDISLLCDIQSSKTDVGRRGA
jgi:hypothetical protein